MTFDGCGHQKLKNPGTKAGWVRELPPMQVNRLRRQGLLDGFLFHVRVSPGQKEPDLDETMKEGADASSNHLLSRGRETRLTQFFAKLSEKNR